jgi:hypothetical protein
LGIGALVIITMPENINTRLKLVYEVDWFLLKLTTRMAQLVGVRYSLRQLEIPKSLTETTLKLPQAAIIPSSKHCEHIIHHIRKKSMPRWPKVDFQPASSCHASTNAISTGAPRRISREAAANPAYLKCCLYVG